MKERLMRRFSRRGFLRLSGGLALGAGAAGALGTLAWPELGLAAVPASQGYLLVDTKKCQGCMSCMLACSLVHEGRINPSLARIQVVQSAFQAFPDDLTLAQCRQCAEPACVAACPADALTADAAHGYVRRVDKTKCIGCMSCVKACPFTPSRAGWNFEAGHAAKCDLCVEAPFFEGPGGPDGKQACVEVCPLKAISFTRELPVQAGTEGYMVNLRSTSWRGLGYSTK